MQDKEEYELTIKTNDELESKSYLLHQLEENDRLRLEIITLRNNQIIFADCKDVLQKVK